MTVLIRGWRRATAFAAALSCASCATVPSYVAPVSDPARFSLRTWEAVYPSTVSPVGPPVGLATDQSRVDGIRCTLSNDLGEWVVVTPADVEVPTSAHNRLPRGMVNVDIQLLRGRR